MHQYQINSYQFPFWQLLKGFWGQNTHKELSWQKTLWFNAELVVFSPRRWNPSPSEFGQSASAKMQVEKILVAPHRQHCVAGKLRTRLWSEHFLYRIDWKYNSDRDIWLCKWVQTICQAICHLEQLHFANAGRRHHRFLLDICATVAWGAVVMLLCPSSCFTLCPRLGYKKLPRWAGFLSFNLNNSKRSNVYFFMALFV